jgi:hypothetical protein
VKRRLLVMPEKLLRVRGRHNGGELREWGMGNRE